MNERRNIPRWQINRQAKVKLEDAECFTDCQIKDINFKGIQISLGEKLSKDTFIRLSLCLDEDCAISIEAWVVWHKTKDGSNSYGLYFTRIKDTDKEKTYRFVQRCCPEQIKGQYCQDTIIEKRGGEVMQSPSFEDKRIFERFSTRLPLKFLDLYSNKEGRGETLDISAKGIGLVANTEIEAQTPLELWLEIPDKGEPLYTRGQVVWSEMLEQNKCRLGVNLEKANLMGLGRALRTI
jgi:hypothetical protein